MVFPDHCMCILNLLTLISYQCIREFIAEFTHEDTWGPGGILEERGLIPMPDAERIKFSNDAKSMNALANR